MKTHLTNKLVLEISNNPEKLFSGISTNTLDKTKNAFVDAFGKIIITFDQIKISEDKILITFEKQFLNVLMNHLEKYVKLSKVKISTTNFKVYFNLEEDYKPDLTEHTIPQNKGQLILTNKNLNLSVSEQEFTEFRLKNNIPIQGTDYNNEMLMNVDPEYISFTKGCFLGQEVFARIHSRSKPPKKLVVKYLEECTSDEQTHMSSKCTNSINGKIIGFIFTKT